MTHDNTKSKAEESARTLYKTASGEKLDADAKTEQAVSDLIALSRQSDALEYKMSELRGRIMEYMKEASVLVGSNGRLLATWSQGKGRKKVDVDALALAYNIPPKEMAKFTTVSEGSRTFKVEG